MDPYIDNLNMSTLQAEGLIAYLQMMVDWLMD